MKKALSLLAGCFVSALVALSFGGCAEEPPRRANSSEAAAVAASGVLTLTHELPAAVAILGAPVEWSLVVENRGDGDLKTGSWTATPTCDVFLWMAGIDYSLIDLDRSEPLELTPLLPEPADYPPGIWLEPDDQRTLICDLTKVFPLDRPGRFDLKVEVAGLPFAIAADETRRLEDTTIFRTLPQSRQGTFEIRRLPGNELDAWRQRAGDGDVTAIRVVGAHRDLQGLADLERAIRSEEASIRHAAALAIVRLPTTAATDALGRAMKRELAPALKEEIAWLMVEEREGLEAGPWIADLGKDTVVFHEFERSGQAYRHYRLRSLAKEFFARRSEPLYNVQVEETIRR